MEEILPWDYWSLLYSRYENKEINETWNSGHVARMGYVNIHSEF